MQKSALLFSSFMLIYKYEEKIPCSLLVLLRLDKIAIMTNVVQLKEHMSLSEEISDRDLCRAIVKNYHAEYNPGFKIDFSRLEFFDEATHGYLIQQMARGMSIVEILDAFCTVWEALPEFDQFFFATKFLQGRAEATKMATDQLFKNMDADAKSGLQATLAYLNRFGTDWKGQADVGSGAKTVRIEVVDE